MFPMRAAGAVWFIFLTTSVKKLVLLDWHIQVPDLNLYQRDPYVDLEPVAWTQRQCGFLISPMKHQCHRDLLWKLSATIQTKRLATPLPLNNRKSGPKWSDSLLRGVLRLCCSPPWDKYTLYISTEFQILDLSASISDTVNRNSSSISGFGVVLQHWLANGQNGVP